MPFQSDKQRRYLYSEKPEVARKFAAHEGKKMPYGKPYTGEKFHKGSPGGNPHGKSGMRYGHSNAHWKEGMSYADCLRRYPMGPGKNPMTNDSRKRYSASNIGGGSVGGGT